jgi:hypothetical protein
VLELKGQGSRAQKAAQEYLENPYQPSPRPRSNEWPSAKKTPE